MCAYKLPSPGNTGERVGRDQCLAENRLDCCINFTGLPFVTNYHKPGILKQQKFILTVLEPRSPRSRCQPGHASSGGSGRGPLLAPSSSGGPRCSLWLHRCISVSIFMCLPVFSGCVFCSSVSCKDTCNWV